MTRPNLRLNPLLAATAVAAITLATPVARGAEAPAYAITGDATFIGDRAATTGFIFTAQSDASLTALGFHDYQLDGLNVAHEVALYGTDGSLLAITTVDAGPSSPLAGEYRYSMLASAFTLQAGTQYVLAAHSDSSDGYRYATVPPASLSVNPLIAIGPQAGVYTYGPSLSFPSSQAGYDIYATPNMLLAPVPEPGTWALACAGLAALAGQARRRRD